MRQRSTAAVVRPPGQSIVGATCISVSRSKVALLAALSLAAAILGVTAVGSWSIARDLPDVRKIIEYRPQKAHANRMFVPAGAIPQLVVDAFLSAEDSDFYHHPGIEVPFVLRDVLVNLLRFDLNRRPIGASTITQQVVKNLLLNDEVSLKRKAQEAVLALRLERSLSKDRILELYLNEIYLGCRAYGVAEAAQRYFDKSLDQLSLPETAFLAGLPKAPTHYNPVRFPDAARARRNWVLDRMAEDGRITSDSASRAKTEPLHTSVAAKARC